MKDKLKIPLRALERYVEEAHGTIDIGNGVVEARFPINIEARGESVYFTIKGRLLPNNIVELTSYVIERGDELYERPSDELEGWIMIVRERYSREKEE